MPDQIEFVLVAEVPGQEVPESVGRKGEPVGTAVRFAHRPDRRIGRRRSPHGQGAAQDGRIRLFIFIVLQFSVRERI